MRIMRTISVKLYKGNIIYSYAICISKNIKYSGMIIETDIDVDNINIASDNYKLVDGELVELSEEEMMK